MGRPENEPPNERIRNAESASEHLRNARAVLLDLLSDRPHADDTAALEAIDTRLVLAIQKVEADAGFHVGLRESLGPSPAIVTKAAPADRSALPTERIKNALEILRSPARELSDGEQLTELLIDIADASRLLGMAVRELEQRASPLFTEVEALWARSIFKPYTIGQTAGVAVDVWKKLEPLCPLPKRGG